MDRRTLLAAAGGFLSTSRLFAGGRSDPVAGGGSVPAGGGELRPLWPGSPPGGGGPSGPFRIGRDDTVTNVAMPALGVYRPARSNGAAVLVAPGAGYKRLNLGMEAIPAATWLTAHGITAYVLYYRLPGEGWADGPLAPLQDAQRALRLVRSETRGPVGVLGFSAGGHLLGLAATRSGFASYRPVDGLDRLSARPDDAALIYPIVTLEPPFDHTSTRVKMVGRHPTLAEAMDWSVQTHVRPGCPPMFLVQAEDDPISDIANTALLADACRAAGVPVERIVLPSGGHGFGMGHAGSPTAAWPGLYRAWLRKQGVRA